MIIRANNILININNCHGIELTATGYIKLSFTQSHISIPIKDINTNFVFDKIENSIINKAISLDISKYIDNSNDRYKDQ